jgi:hypothetical protein
MLELLLIDVALCAALIMVAALVVIRRRRGSNGQPPASAGARGAAAGSAGTAMAPREIAIVPGFAETVPPDPGAAVPVRPEQDPHSHAAPAASPQPDPPSPAPSPNGQQATARGVTTGGQIASYYDQADQPMADYLTALGWTHQPSHSLPSRRWRLRQASTAGAVLAQRRTSRRAGPTATVSRRCRRPRRPSAVGKGNRVDRFCASLQRGDSNQSGMPGGPPDERGAVDFAGRQQAPARAEGHAGRLERAAQRGADRRGSPQVGKVP